MRFQKRIFTAVVCCLGIVGLFTPVRQTQAGWTGYLLGNGSGWAYTSISPWAKVTNSAGLVYYTNLTASALKSITVTNPGSYQGKLTPLTDPLNTNRLAYTTNKISLLSSSNTISRAWGNTGAVWTAYTYGAAGDKTDNFELQNRVKIKPANCAELVMDSLLTGFNGVGGEITVKTFGTPGTALWLRGFEITPGMEVPEDDLNTPENETTEFLKEFADLRFENLVIGPFEYGYNGKCELVIHFTLESGNIDNLAFITDGVALSNPIEIACPEPQTVVCGQPYAYPIPTATGGCGNLTFSFSPAVEDLILGPNTVTVTATDGAGDTGTCEFVVTVTDATAPVPNAASLPTIKGQCSAAITAAPTALDRCVGTVTGTTTDPLTYTTQGTHIVTWTFDDGHGNISTQTQTVEVDDTIAPIAPVLPEVSSGCAAPVTLTAPTAPDNCKGLVTGTTTTVFPITALGTHNVVWTFNDGNGNSSTSTQKVVISGITFLGFYAPIGTSGGTCDRPAKNIKSGSNLPIKFDMKCGSTFVTSGPAPVVRVEKWKSDCTFESTLLSVNAEYQNDWHANWDTSGVLPGVYKIIVRLPDGSEPYVFVTLK